MRRRRSHRGRIKPTRRWRREHWGGLKPYGAGETKPNHYKEIVKTVWENRRNLRYAWRSLRRGVCDGCALGVAGFHDWTISGVHLCMTRLDLLKVNTMGELDPSALADVESLRSLSGKELRDLGRLPYPMVRREGERGFRRVSWDDALDLVADRLRPHIQDGGVDLARVDAAEPDAERLLLRGHAHCQAAQRELAGDVTGAAQRVGALAGDRVHVDDQPVLALAHLR